MKKNLFFLLIVVVIISINSCKKERDITTGNVQFSFDDKSEPNLKSALTPNASDILISIEDSLGNSVYESEKIELYTFNGTFISKPLALNIGSYKLTCFMVLDNLGNVIFATPKSGSSKAYLVENPLDISFSVSEDIVTKLTPEVLRINESTPAEFGYFDTSFQIVETFDFLVSVFVYDSVSQNFMITDASITIADSVKDLYTLPIEANTNTITINDGLGIYKIAVDKSGYKSFKKTFITDSLKAYANTPLIIILTSDNDLTKGLVAYYPFNGNAGDESGNGNNGTVVGATLTTDRYGTINSAYKFNGSDNYIVASNSDILQITGDITMSVWIKSVHALPYAGIICEANPFEPRVGYMMGINDENKVRADLIYNHQTGQDGILISSMVITDGLWHHLLAVYEDDIFKIFIDGQLDNQIYYSDGLQTNNEPLLIGWDESTWLSHRHFDGSIDDIRIYNRALNENEILELYMEAKYK